MKMKHLWIISLLVVSTACTKAPAKVEAAKPAPFRAKTASAAERMVTDGIEANGTLAALESSAVVAETEGVVQAVFVEAGQYVAAGAPLVRLKTTRVQLRLDQAAAAEKQAEAMLEQARVKFGADVEQLPEPLAAKANLQGAEAEATAARAEADRCERLVKTGDVSRTEFDRARANAQAAEARRQAAAQQYQAALRTARQEQVQIKAADAQRASARAIAALEAQQLNDAIVRAPFAGFVSERAVSPGEYVNPSVKVATIEKVQPLRVLLQAPETAAARIQPGARVTLRAAAFPDDELAATVHTIHPTVTAETRTVTVEARLPNADRRWKPGMFVNGVVEASQPRAVVFVPRSAVTQDAATEATIVWTSANGIARVNPVRLGRLRGDEREIITGLTKDARVITNPSPALFDGLTIEEVR